MRITPLFVNSGCPGAGVRRRTSGRRGASALSRRLVIATIIVSQLTLLSRLLGFARDVVVAHAFGAGPATDAFFVAFRIPNLTRRLFGEGAFAQAFVPVLAEYRLRGNPAALRGLVAHLTGALGTILLTLTLAGMALAPVVVAVFAPGFVGDGARYTLATDMLRLTFPYVFCIGLTALAGSILNVHGHFAVPALTPVLLNLCLIAAVFWLAPQLAMPIESLAWATLAAGILQLAFQLPFLRRIGLAPRPRLSRRHAGVARVLRLMGPALVGASVTQLSQLLSTVMASFLAVGSVSWLYYADRLIEFPLGLIGVAVGTVILPALSERHASADGASFARLLDTSLRLVLLLTLPCVTGLGLLAGPILATLFHHGAMSVRDVTMTAAALSGYAIGLVGFVCLKVLAPGFYARQDTRTPVRIAVIALGANTVLALLLVGPLQHVGLAFASSLSALLNAGLMLRALVKAGIYRPMPGWSALVARLLIMNIVLACLLVAFVPDVSYWLAWSGTRRVAMLAIWIGAGVLIYLGTALLLGLRPAEFALSARAAGNAPGDAS